MHLLVVGKQYQTFHKSDQWDQRYILSLLNLKWSYLPSVTDVPKETKGHFYTSLIIHACNKFPVKYMDTTFSNQNFNANNEKFLNSNSCSEKTDSWKVPNVSTALIQLSSKPPLIPQSHLCTETISQLQFILSKKCSSFSISLERKQGLVLKVGFHPFWSKVLWFWLMHSLFQLKHY